MTDLREQVAFAIYGSVRHDAVTVAEAQWLTHSSREAADAAIRVVLAAVAEQIDEPLRNRLHEIKLDDVHGYERALDDVLAVVARLGQDADSPS